MTPIYQSLCFALLSSLAVAAGGADVDYAEATIDDIQSAFASGRLTSRQLVEYYITRIHSLNPHLHAVIELNPDALSSADAADRQRRHLFSASGTPLLHGIPILLKDNIATRDRLNTTAGSFALLGSTPPRDAGVVRRLRAAGAIILGKASMSEWANFRSLSAPNGWSARGGWGLNPYAPAADPCGSSSGSAIAAAAGMAAAALGTETDGSIICPAAANSVVGIKPTVGLTSRAGVVPLSPRQDTVGPIARTVADAVAVLEAIVGYDERDAEVTKAAAGFIPVGGYRQFLKADGLKGKRLGILRKWFFTFEEGSVEEKAFAEHFQVMRQKGAILVDNLEIANASSILNPFQSGEETALLAEFKLSLNAYLSELATSPVRSLADVIAFNNKHKTEEMIEEYGQVVLLAAEKTNGLGAAEKDAIKRMIELSVEGLERLIKEKKLDAVVTPNESGSPVLAIGGYPGISVPAGYSSSGVPFGICFGGLKGSEPVLIEIAYAFERATKVRKPPLLSSVEGLRCEHGVARSSPSAQDALSKKISPDMILQVAYFETNMQFLRDIPPEEVSLRVREDRDDMIRLSEHLASSFHLHDHVRPPHTPSPQHDDAFYSDEPSVVDEGQSSAAAPDDDDADDQHRSPRSRKAPDAYTPGSDALQRKRRPR